MTDAIVYLQRDKGWGAHVKVTVASTELADIAAAAFFNRAMVYVAGENYHTGYVDEENSGPLGTRLEAIFYPTCEHGMSAHLCSGPNHYETYEQERSRAGY